MKQILFAICVWVSATTISWGTEAQTESKTRRPNIVYIMADELGYYEPSCMGNPNIKTPHIDRLAKEGILFTQALAGAPVCAPTRCVLMTGKHSGHTSVRSNGGGTPLRADEVVGRERRGGRRVGHDLADLAAHELGGRLVGPRIEQQVAVGVHERQAALLPAFLVGMGKPAAREHPYPRP